MTQNNEPFAIYREIIYKPPSPNLGVSTNSTTFQLYQKWFDTVLVIKNIIMGGVMPFTAREKNG